MKRPRGVESQLQWGYELFRSSMALRGVRNRHWGLPVLSVRHRGFVRLNSGSSHCSEESKGESLTSEWYGHAFSKLSSLSSLLKNVDLVNGRLVNVTDNSRVQDDILLETMTHFKSLARDFIGGPLVQDSMRKNMVKMDFGSSNPGGNRLPCFNKASEREPMTVNSLTKVSSFLNVTAQQRKVVRATVCPRVTEHQVWTGALELILGELKSEIEHLESRFPSKEVKMGKQIVAGCLKVLGIAVSYNPDSSSWMRVAPAKGKVSPPPTPHKWEDILEMVIDVVDCLREVTELSLEVKKAEVMKEGLYQIREIRIDKNIGYRENCHQESLVKKILTKRLGHSSPCLFTLLTYYLYGSIRDIEVDVRGGVCAIGRGDRFRLCMGKILTSDEEEMVWRGVKQLDRAMGLFKFIWETAGMKGDLVLQGHLWCIGTHSRSLTYRGNTFCLHVIDRYH
ncbi:hypothetical protein DM860_000634 [Cuscuta australis]|uniref:Uncharacterized protein n=1 Tax=Cuscuta australis TaxID=267555 RepID=A0A328CZ36_9ASTE|nr:hypothetical protein DM860_000634 [Cuscuta australis]